MPTYEYQCLKCHRKFEQVQRMTEPPVKKCAQCKGKVERLISAGAGLIFKGSGFYITDYKKNSSAGQTTGRPSAGKPAAPVKSTPSTGTARP